jgi:D-alanyl-D-alanine carboxypeptidase-like protein
VTLPVHPVTLPADLVGVDNGRLPPELLESFATAGRTGLAQAHRTALRSWRALVGECQTATGCVLTITSVADAYRSYERQVATFLARYSPTPIPGRPTKFWDGRTWWLRPGMAMAATPGTSNHGRAIAFDGAVWNGSVIVSLAGDPIAWPWVRANAERFGFSWEAQSEPWHLRLVTGDAIPAAVLAYEKPSPPPPDEEDDMPLTTDDLKAIREIVRSELAAETVNTPQGPKPEATAIEWIKTDTTAIKATVNKIAAATGVDPQAIADAVADELHERTAE